MLVKPTAGLVVRDPATMRALPADGIPAADGDLYWARLARDGDVTLHPDPEIVADDVTPPAVPHPDPVPASEPVSSGQGEAA